MDQKAKSGLGREKRLRGPQVYKLTYGATLCFQYVADPEKDLQEEALDAIREQLEHFGVEILAGQRFKIQQIKTASDIPDGWGDEIPWGGPGDADVGVLVQWYREENALASLDFVKECGAVEDVDAALEVLTDLGVLSDDE